MFEVLRSKKAATLAVALFGGTLAVGCGNTVDGIGNVPMVHCGSHDQPRTNSANISNVPSGEQIQMGAAIVTNDNGNHPATGDFVVASEGYGKFKISINGDNNSNEAEIIPNYPDQPPNTVTVSDNGQLYTISGSPGPDGSTALSIGVKCL